MSVPTRKKLKKEWFEWWENNREQLFTKWKSVKILFYFL
jgi:hypothetical protein